MFADDLCVGEFNEEKYIKEFGQLESYNRYVIEFLDVLEDAFKN